MEVNGMAEKRGQGGVIKEYFNMTTGDMRVEYKELSDDQKLELAKEQQRSWV